MSYTITWLIANVAKYCILLLEKVKKCFVCWSSNTYLFLKSYTRYIKPTSLYVREVSVHLLGKMTPFRQFENVIEL